MISNSKDYPEGLFAIGSARQHILISNNPYSTSIAITSGGTQLQFDPSEKELRDLHKLLGDTITAREGSLVYGTSEEPREADLDDCPTLGVHPPPDEDDIDRIPF